MMEKTEGYFMKKISALVMLCLLLTLGACASKSDMQQLEKRLMGSQMIIQNMLSEQKQLQGSIAFYLKGVVTFLLVTLSIFLFYKMQGVETYRYDDEEIEYEPNE